MSNILLSVIVLIGLASCTDNPNVDIKNTQYKVGTFGEEVKLFTIEGCEYFLLQFDRSISMCHKGNCSNPIHKKQEQ